MRGQCSWGFRLISDRAERDYDEYQQNERGMKNEEQHVIPVFLKGSSDLRWVTTKRKKKIKM